MLRGEARLDLQRQRFLAHALTSRHFAFLSRLAEFFLRLNHRSDSRKWITIVLVYVRLSSHNELDLIHVHGERGEIMIRFCERLERS